MISMAELPEEVAPIVEPDVGDKQHAFGTRHLPADTFRGGEQASPERRAGGGNDGAWLGADPALTVEEVSAESLGARVALGNDAGDCGHLPSSIEHNRPSGDVTSSWPDFPEYHYRIDCCFPRSRRRCA